jgi:hypothetical protein
MNNAVIGADGTVGLYLPGRGRFRLSGFGLTTQGTHILATTGVGTPKQFFDRISVYATFENRGTHGIFFWQPDIGYVPRTAMGQHAMEVRSTMVPYQWIVRGTRGNLMLGLETGQSVELGLPSWDSDGSLSIPTPTTDLSLGARGTIFFPKGGGRLTITGGFAWSNMLGLTADPDAQKWYDKVGGDPSGYVTLKLIPGTVRHQRKKPEEVMTATPVRTSDIDISGIYHTALDQADDLPSPATRQIAQSTAQALLDKLPASDPLHSDSRFIEAIQLLQAGDLSNGVAKLTELANDSKYSSMFTR